MNTSQLMFSVEGASGALPAAYAALVWAPVLLLTAAFVFGLLVLMRPPREPARSVVSEVAARLRRQRRSARGPGRVARLQRTRRPVRKPIPVLQPAR